MTPGTLVTGQRGTTTGNADNRRVDMADKILLLDPDAAPLTVISKRISKRSTGNPQFKWQEDELDPRSDAINFGAGYSNVDVSIVVDNGPYFYAQCLVYVPRTGETMRVTAVATNTLTVERGVGDSSGFALVDNDELIITSSAQPEGDASKTARSRNQATVYNYCQIIRTEWDATQTGLHSEYEATDDWDHQALKHGIEHKVSLEYASMLGTRGEDTSSGQARRYSGGFKHFATENITAVAGALTEWEFFNGLRPMFEYGASEKWAFASPLAIDVLNGFPRGKLEVRQNEKTFGIRVMQYISPHGTLNVIKHRLLRGTTLGGQILVMDSDVVAYRYLQNKRGSRDTHIKKEIQAPDVDGRKDEYLTESGSQFGSPLRHGSFTGIEA